MSTSNTKNAAMDTNVVHMAVRNAGLAQTASMAVPVYPRLPLCAPTAPAPGCPSTHCFAAQQATTKAVPSHLPAPHTAPSPRREGTNVGFVDSTTQIGENRLPGTYRVGCFGFDREGLARQGLHGQLHDGCGGGANPAMLVTAELSRAAVAATASAAAAIGAPPTATGGKHDTTAASRAHGRPDKRQGCPRSSGTRTIATPPPTRRSLSPAKRAGAPPRCTAGCQPRLRPPKRLVDHPGPLHCRSGSD